jgi:ABC-type bacteriocin/lantibiotic exporter with double-glycine peptidase domain
MVTSGVKDLLLGTLGTAVNLFSDFSMLLIVVLGLFLVDPVTAFITIILFGFIGCVLYRSLQVKARTLGQEIATRSIANDSKILEVLRSYRESVVRNRRSYYAKEIGKLHSELAGFVAEVNFIPFISKFVMDSATVISALILGGLVLTLNNAVHGVATLSIFLAASARIASSALRIQQGLILLKTSQGSAEMTLNLIGELKDIEVEQYVDDQHDFNYIGFNPKIEITDVSFSYSGSENFALRELNLIIEAGESVAFVGTSGAGKTTLIDLILGVLDPDSGSISISGHSPAEVAHIWPGAIAYVPQDVIIVSGSVSDNVRLGYPAELVTKNSVERALSLAQLLTAVSEMEMGIDSFVGESGSLISGGQRQRLGIARAFFTHPKLLVLDEATSALDGQTEAELTQAINSLHGEVTVLVVAHRLSTVRQVDKVVYLEAGRITAVGSFEEVRAAVPDFDKQAELMGL